MKSRLALLVFTVALCLTRSGEANDIGLDEAQSGKAVEALRGWTTTPRAERKPVSEQPFASVALTRADAERARELLRADHLAMVRETRGEDLKNKVVKVGNASMKYEAILFPAADGAKPDEPRALFLSMHGGGGAPPHVNESQWKNQVRLGKMYAPVNALYVAPRAPTDTWDLWHKPDVDMLFGRLIADLIATANVDPNQVYLMGYSAGGDGVYQLAPRMADRLAAASMMAGHPNNASPRGLRNLPFTIHVGGEDGAYSRNRVALDWEKQLQELKNADPQGYEHFVHVHAGKGHWMDLEDKEAIAWMQKFRRNPRPEKIVWRQGNTVHDRFYWLAVDKKTANPGDEVVATRKDQTIDVAIVSGKPTVKVLLNDAIADLDQAVAITAGGKEVFRGSLPRTIGTLQRTLEERGDPESIFSAEVVLPATQPAPG